MVDKDGQELGVHLWVWCPGCDEAHAVRVSSTQGDGVWGWNGDLEFPTFTPSLLVTGAQKCHSFITDGKIRFLGDCDHDLKNQTVPLPELPDWLANE
jgi:hypothetical protein